MEREAASGDRMANGGAGPSATNGGRELKAGADRETMHNGAGHGTDRDTGALESTRGWRQAIDHDSGLGEQASREETDGQARGEGNGEQERSTSWHRERSDSELMELDSAIMGPDRKTKLPMAKLAAISCIAGGVQFGWAIQLSLLTPYVQTLGIPHQWASFIWLCGPISGLLVQPVIGVWSDRCAHPLGRRRPFIVFGALFIIFAVLLISYASEIGFMLGDVATPDVPNAFRPMACLVFVLGFWCLDLSNNTVQGPSRALLADLTTSEQCNAANSFYSLWIAIGSVLGYSAGAVGSWYQWFPILTSGACSMPCANLKAAFLLHIGFLSVCTAVTCVAAEEVPLKEALSSAQEATDGPGIELVARHCATPAWGGRHGPNAAPGSPSIADAVRGVLESHRESTFSFARAWRSVRRRLDLLWAKDGEGTLLRAGENSSSYADSGQARSSRASGSTASLNEPRGDLGSNGSAQPRPKPEAPGMMSALRQMNSTMKVLLAITALSWVAWFPFLLFDTDWMGREVYHGDLTSTDPVQAERYHEGVRMGALGLLLFAVVQGLSSAWLDPLCRRYGPAIVWGVANSISAACLLAICGLSIEAFTASPLAVDTSWLPALAVGIFAVLGAPFATTLVVPFTLAAQCSAEAGIGVGLSMGILNLAIVAPQIVVSLCAGPLDGFFGGGNLPAFVAAFVFSVISAFGAFVFLPRDLTMTSSVDPLSIPHV